jgi:hypothetical protein
MGCEHPLCHLSLPWSSRTQIQPSCEVILSWTHLLFSYIYGLIWLRQSGFDLRTLF